MTFDPANKTEIDRLFGLTERGPFSGNLPGVTSLETPEFPLMPGSITEEQYWPLYLQSFIRGGFYNDRWVAPPPDGLDSAINNTDNRLPGWEKYFSAEGTAATIDDFTVTWKEDSAFSPNHGQYTLQLVLPSDWPDVAQAGIRTRMHMPAGNLQFMWPTITIEGGTALADLQLTCAVIGINPDGTEATAVEVTHDLITTDDRAFRAMFRTISRYAFYDVVWYFNWPASSGRTATARTIYLYSPTLNVPQHYTVNVHGYRDDLTVAASNNYKLHRNVMGNDRPYIAPHPGIIVSASAAHTGFTFTAGDIEAWVRVKDGAAGGTTDWSSYLTAPVPILDKDTPTATHYLDLDSTAWAGFTGFMFKAGDQLLPMISTTSALAGSGLTGDIYADFTVLMFADELSVTGREGYTIAVA